MSTDLAGAPARTTVEREIGSGRLVGFVEDGIDAFLGIPYAEAPVGALRFQPPQRRRAWNGARDAQSLAAACPQPSLPQDPEVEAFINAGFTGADCLNLNVWAPHHHDGHLPVMVWIHGGGFIAGSGSARICHGGTWARDGIVYVSINYRMHVDGFLYFDDRSTGNLGLQDQIAALRWVQENIAAFGGDPTNVTVFGQSAGAVSIAHLLSAPAAQGLFRRAIVQSGTTEGGLSIDDALEITDRLAQRLGIDPTPEGFSGLSMEATLPAVLNLTIEYLSPALWGKGSFTISPFRPVLGDDTLPEPILPSLGEGRSAGVDLMVGTCRDEMTFAMQPTGLLPEPPPPWVDFALDAFGVTKDWLETYRDRVRPGARSGEVLSSAWTDWAFMIPSMHLAEVHSRRTPSTYLYEFWWPSPSIPDLGASHALDLPFTADVLEAFQRAHRTTVSPLGDQPPQALAHEMHQAWVGFARTGSPGWDRYNEQSRITKIFDAPSRLVEDSARVQREAWAGLR